MACAHCSRLILDVSQLLDLKNVYFVEVVSQSCGLLLVTAANNLRVVALAAKRLP